MNWYAHDEFVTMRHEELRSAPASPILSTSRGVGDHPERWEIVFYTIMIIVGLLMLFCSPPLGSHWVDAG